MRYRDLNRLVDQAPLDVLLRIIAAINLLTNAGLNVPDDATAAQARQILRNYLNQFALNANVPVGLAEEIDWEAPPRGNGLVDFFRRNWMPVAGLAVLAVLAWFVIIPFFNGGGNDNNGGGSHLRDDSTSALHSLAPDNKDAGKAETALESHDVDVPDAKKISGAYASARDRGLSQDEAVTTIKNLDADVKARDIVSALDEAKPGQVTAPTPTPVKPASTPAPSSTPATLPTVPAGNPPAPQATQVPATVVPTQTAPQLSPTPANQQANSNSCATNSPNIPCIKAQATQAGFTPFTVNGNVIGGPAEQWWPLQRANGDFVHDSYKMVGMRQNDVFLPGYEMNVPAGKVLDVWLDNAALNNRKSSVRIWGPANVNAGFRVAEATLYDAPVDFVPGLAGKWARMDDEYRCGDYVAVGTVPPVITSAHDCHLASASGVAAPASAPMPISPVSAMTGTQQSVPAQQTAQPQAPAQGSAPPAQQTAAPAASGLTPEVVKGWCKTGCNTVTGYDQLDDGKVKIHGGGTCAYFDIPAGYVFNNWDGATNKTVSGSGNKTCEATAQRG